MYKDIAAAAEGNPPRKPGRHIFRNSPGQCVYCAAADDPIFPETRTAHPGKPYGGNPFFPGQKDTGGVR